MQNTAKFWDKIAAKYAKRPVKNEEAYQWSLGRVGAHLSPNDHVLEIGCGTGSTALTLAGKVSHYTASDLSQAMIDIARQKADDQGVENLRLVTGTVFSDELEQGSFDAVLAFSLLHLVEDLPGVVARVHDLLKPGGLFISKSPCLGDDGVWIKAIVYLMQKVGYAPFIGFFTKSELLAQISSAGFEIVESDVHPTAKSSRFIVARKL